MKIMFFATDRYGSRRALKTITKNGFEVVGCVGDSPSENQLSQLCRKNKIPYFANDEMYKKLECGELPEFDYGISYLHSKILKEKIIDFSHHGIINFHPAPIQVHRGIAACCYSLLKEQKEWGVTAHYIVPKIDEGDIIQEKTFSIEAAKTAIEVERIVQEESIALLENVLDLLKSGEKLSRKKQNLSLGHYFSRQELEREKEIKDTDPTDIINKKIRAFWFPPYKGAYIELNGEKYTLIDDAILEELAELYQQNRKMNENQDT